MIVHQADWTRALPRVGGPSPAPAGASDAQLLLDSTGEGIYGVDTRGVCTFVNRSAAEMLGYEPLELVGRKLHELIHHSREDGAPYPVEACPIYGAFRAGRGVRVEGEPFWRRDGSSFPTRYSSFPIVEGGAVTGAVVTFSDITGPRRAEAALRQAHDDLERRVAERTAGLTAANLRLEAEIAQRTQGEVKRAELLRRLVSLQEEERHRIARELHDQMGQHLTAFVLDLEALKGHLHERPAAAEALQRLRDLADRMGQDVHRIAFELRPSALDDWGLQTALTNYVTAWSRRGRVMAQVHCTGMDRRLPAAVETALYRVTQEALTNVLKHARASRVSVIVERREGEVRAIVEDNGRGFDADAVLGAPDARSRLGLLGMEERMAQLGGTLEIESSPGGGTSLFIRVPLDGAGTADHG